MKNKIPLWKKYNLKESSKSADLELDLYVKNISKKLNKLIEILIKEYNAHKRTIK